MASNDAIPMAAGSDWKDWANSCRSYRPAGSRLVEVSQCSKNWRAQQLRSSAAKPLPCDAGVQRELRHPGGLAPPSFASATGCRKSLLPQRPVGGRGRREKDRIPPRNCHSVPCERTVHCSRTPAFLIPSTRISKSSLRNCGLPENSKPSCR
jgi:hypothetical protein